MPAEFALVRVPVAPMLREPQVSGAQLSQALFGHALLVVETDGTWRRVRGMLDGYEGWTHEGYLHAVDVPEVSNEDAVPPYERRAFGVSGEASADAEREATAALSARGLAAPGVSLGCTVLAGARRLRLPFGALVGLDLSVLAGEVMRAGERAERFPADGAALVRSATRWFEGTPYQWGGITPWGADCSGLVQAVFGLHGVDLPRDAWQQALVGAERPAEPARALAGDLLFFSDRDDGYVTHVGLAAGDGQMLHVALGRGGWSVDDLADPADAYTERLVGTLVAVRRVLDS